MKVRVAMGSLALAIAGAGCTANQDPYEQAATEVEQTVAALEDGEADASVDEIAAGEGHMHHRRHRRHRRLIARFGDPAALAACAELRAACAEEAGDDSCRHDVRACVHGVLEDAFAAMCEERLAMCEEDGAPEDPCTRIATRCEEGPRFPHRGHHMGPEPEDDGAGDGAAGAAGTGDTTDEG